MVFSPPRTGNPVDGRKWRRRKREMSAKRRQKQGRRYGSRPNDIWTSVKTTVEIQSSSIAIHCTSAMPQLNRETLLSIGLAAALRDMIRKTDGRRRRHGHYLAIPPPPPEVQKMCGGWQTKIPRCTFSKCTAFSEKYDRSTLPISQPVNGTSPDLERRQTR